MTKSSCVSACGEMLSTGSVSQTTLIEKLGAPAPTEELAQHLGSGWIGGYVGHGEAEFTEMMRSGRPWAAQFYEFGAELSHTVVVDGMDEMGQVMIRDPWNGGSTYRMTVEEFLRVWTGVSVFR
jgi:filamentous hemagglutinin